MNGAGKVVISFLTDLDFVPIRVYMALTYFNLIFILFIYSQHAFIYNSILKLSPKVAY